MNNKSNINENQNSQVRNQLFSYQENLKVNQISDITLEKFLENQKETIPLIEAIRFLNSYYQDKPVDDTISYLNQKGYSAKGKDFEEVMRNLKTLLPVAVVSGTFSSRTDLGCINHSGLYVYDYDKIVPNPLVPDKLLELKDRLSKDPLTLSVFISPSGMGLKQIIKGEIVEGDNLYKKEKHKENYINLFSVLENKYGTTLDTQCKNISRATFTSSDHKIYINYDSERYMNPVHSISKTIDLFEIEGQESESPVVKVEVPTKINLEVKETPIRKQAQVESLKSMVENPFEVKITNSIKNKIPKEIHYEENFKVEMAIRTIKKLSTLIQYEHGKNMRDSFFTFIVSMLDILDPKKTRELASLFGCKQSSYIEDTIKNFDKDQADSIYIFALAKKHNIDLHDILEEIRNEDSTLIPTRKTLIAKEINTSYEVFRNEHNNSVKIKKLSKDGMNISENKQVLLNDLLIDLEQKNKELKGLSMNELSLVLSSSHINTYNPVKDFITRLRNNNSQNCIRRLITDCLKTPEDTLYLDGLIVLITKFLASIFAKSLNASQNDMMLILHGGMNLGKTRFLQSLFGFFASEENINYFRVVDKISLKDNNDRDLLISNYIINIDEMIGFSDIDLKNLISLKEINFRIPYDTRMNTYKSRSTLTGTTNNLDFLRDKDNRRFIVLEITEKIDEKYLTEDILNDIWYEAYQYFLTNEAKGIFLDEDDIILVNSLGFSHKLETDLEIIIKDNFCSDDKPKYTTTDILNILNFITNSSIDTRKLGMSLKRIFGNSVSTSDGRKKYKCNLINESILERMSKEK